MSPHLTGRPRHVLWCFAAFVSCVACRPAEAVDKQAVDAAIASGRRYLSKNLGTRSGGVQSLVTYAILKSGGDPDTEPLASRLRSVQRRCGSGEYVNRGGSQAIYVAGIDAMILSDWDPEGNRENLELIRDFILSQQRNDGAWCYVKEVGFGDTSVTQYALLGLWAVRRASIPVPEEAWHRAARWHLRLQGAGGFGYRLSKPTPASNTHTMTAAGGGSMAICARNIRGGSGVIGVPADEEAAPVIGQVRMGVLRPYQLPEPEAPGPAADNFEFAGAEVQKVSVRTLDEAVEEAARWYDERFVDSNPAGTHKGYFYYSLERFGALSDRRQFGENDWYDVCARKLIALQNANGSWSLTNDATISTSFAVLFLSRTTGKLVGNVGKPLFGGGLLIGGRGLPENLDEFGKEPEDEPRRIATPLEMLLEDLQEANDVELPELQEKLVREIQFGERDELVGQSDLIVKLLDHRSADVRRTAVWALGRTGDLRLARFALMALDDPSPAVLTEARNALAWIARLPDGRGVPEAVPKDGVEQWRRGAWEAWGRWYLEASPYDGKLDEFELTVRRRLSQGR